MPLNPRYIIRLPSKGIGADFIIFSIRGLHHLCVDAIAVSARLEHDIGKQNRLAGLHLNSARERQSPFPRSDRRLHIRRILARGDASKPCGLFEQGVGKCLRSSSEEE